MPSRLLRGDLLADLREEVRRQLLDTVGEFHANPRWLMTVEYDSLSTEFRHRGATAVGDWIDEATTLARSYNRQVRRPSCAAT